MNIVREHPHREFLFSTDKKKLDLIYIHNFLTQSYWAHGIPLQLVESSVKNSLCIGIYTNSEQIGFARVVTDYTTFAWLADVFVDERFRGRGLSKTLMTFISSFEEFRLLRRFMLATRDAHGLYAQFAFKPLKSPDRFMELHQPDVYKIFL
jgi:GNAT superfamily N-acetyltransferase